MWCTLMVTLGRAWRGHEILTIHYETEGGVTILSMKVTHDRQSTLCAKSLVTPEANKE